jgi:hypothetical protein
MISPLFDRSGILELLTALAERLWVRGVHANIYVIGGAAISLVFDARRATRDVDSVVLSGHGPLMDEVSARTRARAAGFVAERASIRVHTAVVGGHTECMIASWDESALGVVRLPSGRLVRGRGLRHPAPDGLEPTIGLYLLGREPASFVWETRWIQWPDFWLPTDTSAAKDVLEHAWAEAATERVEIACSGGRGHTGTALALLAVIDGVSPTDAVAFVRANYHTGAVETPWQRRYVERWLA